MTEQEQKAFDQMREALIDIKYGLEKSRIWGGMDWTYNPLHPFKYLPLRDKAEQALTAANAVSEQPQEPKLPEYFAQYEYAPDFSVVVSVYRRHADAVPELIHSEALPKQIGDYPQTSEPQAQGESRLPERDTNKPAEEQGLFRKFDVTRTDGSSSPGGKHHGCEYFVLDVDHDQHAKAALQAYAVACASTHPQLSADLKERYGAHPQATDPQEAIAWEATTPGYIKYVTDRQYRSYSETAKRWYKPYKCSSCHPQATEPAGYKLVPVELTREMLYAIQNDCDIMPQRGKRIWATLLAVAPTPPEAK